MIRNVFSLGLLSFAVWITYVNKTDPYLNVLMAYAFIGLVFMPLVFLGYAFTPKDKLKPLAASLSKLTLNLLWCVVWVKMIIMGYLWSGSLGIIAVIGCHCIMRPHS
jgi:hypothetical protein